MTRYTFVGPLEIDEDKGNMMITNRKLFLFTDGFKNYAVLLVFKNRLKSSYKKITKVNILSAGKIHSAVECTNYSAAYYNNLCHHIWRLEESVGTHLHVCHTNLGIQVHQLSSPAEFDIHNFSPSMIVELHTIGLSKK